MTSAVSEAPAPAAASPCDVVACHDCDLLHRLPALRPGSSAACARCGATLSRRKNNALDRSVAFALAAIVLYALSNLYPFLFFKVQGRVEVNHMISGVHMLFERGMPSLAVAILLTSIVFPGVQVVLLLYLVVPLKLGRTPRHIGRAYRWLKSATPWAMLDVYLLGVLVAVVNLTAIASIELGTGSFCFVALLFAVTASSSHLPEQLIVAQLEARAR